MFNKQIEENKIPEITWLFLKKMRRERKQTKKNHHKPELSQEQVARWQLKCLNDLSHVNQMCLLNVNQMYHNLLSINLNLSMTY